MCFVYFIGLDFRRIPHDHQSINSGSYGSSRVEKVGRTCAVPQHLSSHWNTCRDSNLEAALSNHSLLLVNSGAIKCHAQGKLWEKKMSVIHFLQRYFHWLFRDLTGQTLWERPVSPGFCCSTEYLGICKRNNTFLRPCLIYISVIVTCSKM